jgi:prepilin-type N-terminal cleavage/methylation domain-containing protein
MPTRRISNLSKACLQVKCQMTNVQCFLLNTGNYLKLVLIGNSGRRQRGFTLVELMVSIMIVAILATIGAVMYSSVQKTARVSKRVQDLKAFKTALANYYTDNFNYPKTFDPGPTVVWRSECTLSGVTQVAANSVIPGLIPTYMPVLPSDPLAKLTATANCYAYSSDGRDYKLNDACIANCTGSDMTTADMQTQPSLIDPQRPTLSWSIYTDGARNW